MIMIINVKQILMVYQMMSARERCSVIYAKTAVLGYQKISEEGVVHDFKRDQPL